MKRCLLLLTLLLLPGCDVAVAALLFSSDSGSSDDDAFTAPPTQGLGNVANVWLANLADSAQAAAERATLVTNKGNPVSAQQGGPWTFLGDLSATEVFNPDNAIVFNTILIQVGSDLNFNIDCVELLDTENTVVGYAEGNPYSNLVLQDNSMLGAPDGVCAVTQSTGDTRAFVFTLYPNPIELFRINSRGTTLPPEPGDVLAKSDGSIGVFGTSVKPGGMAVDSNGQVFVTSSLGDLGYLTRFDIAGLVLPLATGFTAADFVQISSNLATVGAGLHAVAVHPSGNIYTSCSTGSGLIQVKRFDSTLTETGSQAGLSSGFNGDRVEHNSIAVDASGNLVVAGGWFSLASGTNHWIAKLDPDLDVSPTWQSPQGSLDTSSTTYWHAVTTAGDEAVATGDLLSALLGGTNQVYTRRYNATGTPIEEQSYPAGETGADVGHALEFDSSGNLYIGGYATTAGNMRNGILIRYEPGFQSGRDTAIIGAAGLNDEILDIAVDTDGSIFVVGYETVTGQKENWFVRKYVYDTFLDEFNVEWVRTHDRIGENDRAQSVVLTGSFVVVAGFETTVASPAQTEVILRVYAK